MIFVHIQPTKSQKRDELVEEVARKQNTQYEDQQQTQIE